MHKTVEEKLAVLHATSQSDNISVLQRNEHLPDKTILHHTPLPDKIKSHHTPPSENENILEQLLGTSKKYVPPQQIYQPPSLAEIRKKQTEKYQEEHEETQKMRNAVSFKYEVLKRMHPKADIPEFTAYSDPRLMSQKYETLTKKLSLDSSVESLRRYLIVGVMLCEVILGKMNLDMEGFAQHQIMTMPTYDHLLVEIAEKSYVPSGNNKWPVELRILSMLLVNTVTYSISNILSKKTGINNFIIPPTEREIKDPTL